MFMKISCVKSKGLNDVRLPKFYMPKMWQGGITNNRHKVLSVLWNKITGIKRNSKDPLSYMSWNRHNKSSAI